MDLSSVTSFVAKALPWIGAAASGNVPALISLAATEVGKITGNSIDPTSDAIHSAIATATPEQLLSLKKADDEIRLKIQALGFQSEKDLLALNVHEDEIAASDRASARAMYTNTRAWTIPILSWGVVALAFGLNGFLMFSATKPAIDDVILGSILATANAALMLVLNFHFGSSTQSHAQTRIMGALSINGNGKGHS